MGKLLWANLVTLAVLLVVVVGLFLGVGYYLSPQNKLTKADVIVAVSGGDTKARAAMAIQLYQAGWAPHLIFSGAAADPSGPSNARAMAQQAEAAGVPVAAIELDESSLNTDENGVNVAAIIKKDGYHAIILVTSPYHQRRAFIVFHHALGGGFVIINHSSLDPAWRRSDWWATPQSRSITFAELQKAGFELAGGVAP